MATAISSVRSFGPMPQRFDLLATHTATPQATSLTRNMPTSDGPAEFQNSGFCGKEISIDEAAPAAMKPMIPTLNSPA